MPIASPDPASYIDPLPQLPPRMALIGVALPLAAPFATLVDVGVLSLWPAIRATWPAQDPPGIVTVSSSSCHTRVGYRWSLAVMNRPSGPMWSLAGLVSSSPNHL